MEEYIEVNKEDRMFIDRLDNKVVFIFVKGLFDNMYSMSLIRQEAKRLFNIDDKIVNHYIKYLLDKEEEEDRKKKEEFIKKYNSILDK